MYEPYITFSREAKYGILISIRIVYGGLRAYIYSTYFKILELSKVFVRYHKQKKFVTNKNPNLMVMSKTVLLEITCRFARRRSGKYNFFQGSQVRCFDFDQIRLWGATSLLGSTRGLFVLLYDEIKIMKTH